MAGIPALPRRREARPDTTTRSARQTCLSLKPAAGGVERCRGALAQRIAAIFGWSEQDLDNKEPRTALCAVVAALVDGQQRHRVDRVHPANGGGNCSQTGER